MGTRSKDYKVSPYFVMEGLRNVFKPYNERVLLLSLVTLLVAYFVTDIVVLFTIIGRASKYALT